MAESWRVSKLDVGVRYEGAVAVVSARGECDLITGRKLKDAVMNVLASGKYRIVFDLGEVDYIDSSGFRVLIEARNKAVEGGGNIVLSNLKPQVARVFDLLRLKDFILQSDTVENGLLMMVTLK